jgi:hypothetical protein
MKLIPSVRSFAKGTSASGRNPPPTSDALSGDYAIVYAVLAMV